MKIYNLFRTNSKETCQMSQEEYFVRTQEVLKKILNIYAQGWGHEILKDYEYPEESICDKCTAGDVFIHNGEEKECFPNREEGYCFHVNFDCEEVITDLEAQFEEIYNLLYVDEIKNQQP